MDPDPEHCLLVLYLVDTVYEQDPAFSLKISADATSIAILEKLC